MAECFVSCLNRFIQPIIPEHSEVVREAVVLVADLHKDVAVIHGNEKLHDVSDTLSDRDIAFHHRILSSYVLILLRVRSSVINAIS